MSLLPLRLLPLLLVAIPASVRGQEPPLPNREFRGVWVATVDNIDWPSKKGLPTAQAQQELAAVVERTAALRCNAIVFQVRPCADAFYASELEPWSEWLTGVQGQPPDPLWDPLQFLLDRAHAEGLEVHAWCNPYRARHPASKSPTAADHVLQKLPTACVRYGDYQWMDPGDPRAADWSLAVVADLVRRYDLDGIHIDDYFYPYPVPGQDFPDEVTFRAYRDGGGVLDRSAWRRSNIDEFVRRFYATAHEHKPWIKVGISPFGIARPGLPKGIKAGIDQYEQLYADVLRWQREGWCDYLSPQLYWPIDQKEQSFATLLPWWQAQNPKQRHVWPGINPGRAAQGRKPWRQDELVQQIELIRARGPDPGHIHFSFKWLRSEQSEVARALAAKAYREAALVPASPWLGDEVPPAPTLRIERRADGTRAVAFAADATAARCVVSVLVGRRWQTLAIRGPGAPPVALPAEATRVAVRAVGRTGQCSAAATAAATAGVDR